MKAKAFHPQTFGVVKPCVVIETKLEIKRVRVEFRESINGGKERFWIPTNHVFFE